MVKWWTPLARAPCPTPRPPGKRGTYPGAGSSQGLPEGLKLHLLVMAHELSQGAMALGAP